MFVEQEDEGTVAAFKRASTGETLAKQQRMKNDVAEYNKLVIRADPRTEYEPDLPAPRKMGKR